MNSPAVEPAQRCDPAIPQDCLVDAFTLLIAA